MIALALRNLWRNQRRSSTTLLAMMIGMLSILLFGGYSRTVYYGLETDFVGRSGHLQLQRKDYFWFGSGDPQGYSLHGYKQLVNDIQQDPVLAPLLRVVTPVLQFGGIAGNFDAGLSKLVIVQGVDVTAQNEMRRWNDYQLAITPELHSMNPAAGNEAEIGIGVARMLQLCAQLDVPDCPQPQLSAIDPNTQTLAADIAALAAGQLPSEPATPAKSGAQLELLAASTGGAPNVNRLQINRAVTTGAKELDEVYLAMQLAQAQQLLYGESEERVTALQIQLYHSADLEVARTRLQELISNRWPEQPLEVHDFRTLNPAFGQITGMFAAIFGFITILISAIVLFTVGNTMSMAVLERTVEIGTLRTLGLRRSGIRRLFISEGLLLGLTGALLGTALALLFAALINQAGFTWLPPGNSNPVPITIRLWGEHQMLLGIGLTVVLVATVSAWWPARRAAQQDVVDALRYV
ncbi:ABC transporter permease [Rheinheimera riviphila]|uniref:ABC transporter permease n=1 Tax=Rheinheimera riviphila TaxID=1834037 RepID=A0A437R1W0_9GAMM|nr:FtsX-like permease family protein [Rheinheimera riviphila]RVU40796.1 ABC transporter permease [Rheinheimera riviphila]